MNHDAMFRPRRLTTGLRAARALATTGLLAACALAGLQACASVERNPAVVGPYSDKLSPFNYKEEGAVARLVVGVDGARLIRGEPYFPLFVQVANKSKETFAVTREAFTLEDSLGRRYAAAPSGEIAERYRRQDLDRRLFRQNRNITLSGVDLYTFVQSNFYPSTSRAALLIDRVSLPPHGLMEDVLYFPIPESGLNGVPLRLLFKVPALDEAIMVVFAVPRTLGALEKEAPPGP